MLKLLNLLALTLVAEGQIQRSSYDVGVQSVIPTHQPWVWPIPREWTMGAETVSFYPNQLTLDYPDNEIIEKAIERYWKILKLPNDKPQMVPYNWTTTSTEAKHRIKGLKISVKDLKADLEVETDESYTLSVQPNKNVELNSTTVWGALRGLETLTQLVKYSPAHKKLVIPHAPYLIKDSPSFKHRGVLLDTSRHYYPLEDIYKLLDSISYNKFNVFHWHMIDATSFPYRSKKYPQLADFGSYGPEFEYDAKAIKKVVQYARERGIRVIPELEAPGHATAWGLGMPEIVSCLDTQPFFGLTVQPPAGQLNPANPKTIEVVKDIIAEWSELFPDHYFHASGDEIVMKCWTEDSQVKSLMEKTNQTSYQVFDKFTQEMHKEVRKHGKAVMVWQEMLLEYNATLPKDTIIQPWFGPKAIKEIVSKGYRTVVSTSEYWYLDIGFGRPRSNPYPDVAGAGFNHWNRVYSYDITEGLTAEESKLVLGGEVTLWGELMDSNNFETLLWPRGAAAGERLWSGYKDTKGQNITSADAILRLLPWREAMVHRGIRATPLNQGYCTRNPLKCFQPPKTN
jgi:hexosaminidase